MGSDEAIEYLAEAEALRLAGTVSLGRVVYSRYAMPAVHLVNFRLDGKDVVFKTRRGAKFAAAVADTVVAFEVDLIDEATRTGWSVTLTGRSTLVTSPAEQERLAGLGVDSWIPDREHFVKVRTQVVAGRRIRPHELVGHDVEDQAS